MNTKQLITGSEFMTKAREVMNGLTQKTRINLVIDKHCREFWALLAHDMYYNATLERLGMDGAVREAMDAFPSDDDLDVVNKSGRILKRFAKFYTKHNDGKKLTDEVMGIIGDRLQYYLTKQNEQNDNGFVFDFATSFDWDDGMYGKSGSCYWGSYAASRPTLESAGAFCIRFYSDMDDRMGTGRTWILVQNGALICFNSYGVERSTTSKVIKAIFESHGVTLHYNRMEIENSYNSDIPYINSGSGFILTPEGTTLEEVTKGDSAYDIRVNPVEANEDRVMCEGCERYFDEDDITVVNGSCYCDRCLRDNFSYCEKCGEWFDNSEVHEVHGLRRYSELCESCLESVGASFCESCQEYSVDYIVTEEGDSYCNDCQEDSAFHCEECEEWHTGDSCPNEHESEEEEEESDVESDSFPEVEKDFITAELETVVTRRYDYSQFERVEMVYRDSRFDGLYVIQNSDGWSVTHEESGFALKSRIESIHKALNLLEVIGNKTNWTRSQADLQNDRALMYEVSALIVEYI